MEFWGYTNQVRLRGLTENQGFCNLRRPGALVRISFVCSLSLSGFNRQVQDMRRSHFRNAIASLTATVSKHEDTTQQPAVVAKQSELVSHIFRKGKPQH
jgi:hypothetical protein